MDHTFIFILIGFAALIVGTAKLLMWLEKRTSCAECGERLSRASSLSPAEALSVAEFVDRLTEGSVRTLVCRPCRLAYVIAPRGASTFSPHGVVHGTDVYSPEHDSPLPSAFAADAPARSTRGVCLACGAIYGPESPEESAAADELAAQRKGEYQTRGPRYCRKCGELFAWVAPPGGEYFLFKRLPAPPAPQEEPEVRFQAAEEEAEARARTADKPDSDSRRRARGAAKMRVISLPLAKWRLEPDLLWTPGPSPVHPLVVGAVGGLIISAVPTAAAALGSRQVWAALIPVVMATIGAAVGLKARRDFSFAVRVKSKTVSYREGTSEREWSWDDSWEIDVERYEPMGTSPSMVVLSFHSHRVLLRSRKHAVTILLFGGGFEQCARFAARATGVLGVGRTE